MTSGLPVEDDFPQLEISSSRTNSSRSGTQVDSDIDPENFVAPLYKSTLSQTQLSKVGQASTRVPFQLPAWSQTASVSVGATRDQKAIETGSAAIRYARVTASQGSVPLVSQSPQARSHMTSLLSAVVHEMRSNRVVFESLIRLHEGGAVNVHSASRRGPRGKQARAKGEKGSPKTQDASVGRDRTI